MIVCGGFNKKLFLSTLIQPECLLSIGLFFTPAELYSTLLYLYPPPLLLSNNNHDDGVTVSVCLLVVSLYLSVCLADFDIFMTCKGPAGKEWLQETNTKIDGVSF